MQLSAEDFHSIVFTAGRMGRRRTGEKRLHIRVGADDMVTIIPCSDADPSPIQVHVCDISRCGIRIRRDEAMDPGQQFILCLSLDFGRKTQTVICVVRRTIPQEHGGFEMGCEFADALQPAVPSDHVLKGLKKFQTHLFAADLEAV